MNTVNEIKRVIRTEVGEAVEGGYGGVDIKIQFCDCFAEEVRQWVIEYYKCGDSYIDWDRDDKYGFGVGYNMNKSFVEGFITFNWKGTYDIYGYVVDLVRQ